MVPPGSDLSARVTVPAETPCETFRTFLRRDARYTLLGIIGGAIGGIAVSESAQNYLFGMEQAPGMLRYSLDLGAAFVYGALGAGTAFVTANAYGLYRLLR